jgi:DNA modification methylase
MRCANDAVEIIVGDCRDTLAAMPDASVDCIVTSPPYFGLRDYECDGQIGLEPSPAEFVAAMVEVFRLARRVLKPEATCWVNLGDSYGSSGGDIHSGFNARWFGTGIDGGKQAAAGRSAAAAGAVRRNTGLRPKNLLMIPARVAIALCDDGWWLRSEIIWHKPNPMPESVTDRPTKAHEHVFLLANSQRYLYDAAAIKERTTKDRAPSRKAKATGAGHAALRGGGTPYDGTGEYRNARTVWTIPPEPCEINHFALMPTELARRCILAGCPKGGVVLDPFAGGGTTGLVAARHGRRAILCELNAEYAAMARDRIAREWKETPAACDADPGPLFAEAR